MNWGRKGALLMLAVVVLWTAIPASACLFAVHSTGRPDCCRGMAGEFDSPSMCANGSCCQAERQNAAVATAPLYSPEQSQKLAVAPHQPGLHLRAFSSAMHRKQTGGSRYCGPKDHNRQHQQRAFSAPIHSERIPGLNCKHLPTALPSAVTWITSVRVRQPIVMHALSEQKSTDRSVCTSQQ